jgi:hypothetical protein
MPHPITHLPPNPISHSQLVTLSLTLSQPHSLSRFPAPLRVSRNQSPLNSPSRSSLSFPSNSPSITKSVTSPSRSSPPSTATQRRLVTEHRNADWISPSTAKRDLTNLARSRRIWRDLTRSGRDLAGFGEISPDLA